MELAGTVPVYGLQDTKKCSPPGCFQLPVQRGPFAADTQYIQESNEFVICADSRAASGVRFSQSISSIPSNRRGNSIESSPLPVACYPLTVSFVVALREKADEPSIPLYYCNL